MTLAIRDQRELADDEPQDITDPDPGALLRRAFEARATGRVVRLVGARA